LVLVVIASIVLWYQYFVPGSIGPILFVRFHMSFRFFMLIAVLSLFGGVITSAIGQIADRRGRAWVVIVGVGLVALLQVFALPNVNSKSTLLLAMVAVGLVEGIMVVVTAALVRDFTPQLGRASAMGFWTLGPVAGLLLGTELVSHTLGATSGDWQRQFIISGVVGLVVFVLALLFLRELSPEIRDQLMVTERDRVLVELKARKLDVESAIAKPWGQMLHFDIVISAIAVNVMLLLWYTATVLFPTFLVTTFLNATNWGSIPHADAILNWMWAADCIGLVVFGILSDIARVRKPFMIVGAIGMLVFIPLLISHVGHQTSGYYTVAWVTAGLFTFQAMSYSTWMASFTETVEARNPALTATGLAIWGSMARFVAMLGFIVIPFMVVSAGSAANNSYVAMPPATAKAVATIDAGKVPTNWDPYYTKGRLTEIANLMPAAGAIRQEYSHYVLIVEAHQKDFSEEGPLTETQLLNPKYAGLYHRLQFDAGGLATLAAMAKIAPLLQFLGYYQNHIQAVLANVGPTAAPRQWQHWLWVCFAGVIFFVPLVFVMKGRWSPRRARKDEREHRRFVDAELAKIRHELAPAGAGDIAELTPR
jgi:MFS family permease